MLTPRQQQVAEMAAMKVPNKEIAQRLGISVKTVEAHLDQVARTLPGNGSPRRKATLWFFNVRDEAA